MSAVSMHWAAGTQGRATQPPPSCQVPGGKLKHSCKSSGEAHLRCVTNTRKPKRVLLYRRTRTHKPNHQPGRKLRSCSPEARLRTPPPALPRPPPAHTDGGKDQTAQDLKSGAGCEGSPSRVRQQRSPHPALGSCCHTAPARAGTQQTVGG